MSAKADYAVRAMLEIAMHGPGLVKADLLISHQNLPPKFSEAILTELRRADLIRSHRGADGGYALTSPPAQITLGAIIQAVDGPLAEIRGLHPKETTFQGAAQHLPDVWAAVRASLHRVLNETTLAHVLSGDLPLHIQQMAGTPDPWTPR